MEKPRFLEIDNKSGYTWVDLSFTLNRFAPIRHINRINADENKQKIEESIYNDFPPCKETYHELCGSTFENLRAPTFNKYQEHGISFPKDIVEMQKEIDKIRSVSQDWIAEAEQKIGLQKPDVDWMVVAGTKVAGYEMAKDTRFIISDKGQHPGYVWLKIVYPGETDPSFKVKMADDYYLSGTAIKMAMEQQLKEKKAQLDYVLSATGPAINLYNIDQYVNETTNVDVVFALPCFSWPHEAEEWVTRERKSGWPNTECISAIIKKGILLVPTSHYASSRPDLDWRFSFSVAERSLCRTFNDVQKQVLVLFKLIKHLYFKETKLLHSYHFKTAMFWVAEELPQQFWKDDNLGKCFIHVLDKMLEFINFGHFPQIFITRCNLIGNLSATEIKTVMDIMMVVRENPVKPFLEFNKLYQIVYLPYTQFMEKILHSFISKRHVTKVLEEDVVMKQLDVLDELGKIHMIEYSYNEAVSIYREYSKLNKLLPTAREFNPECHIMSLAFALDNPRVMKIYEVLHEEFPDSDYNENILCNLAGEYQNAYFKAENQSLKDLYAEKAEETFACAITLPNCKLSTNVYYAHYMFNLKQYGTAISFLEGLVESDEVQSSHSVNAYGKSYMESLDSFFRKEILDHSKVTVPSLAMAHYIITMGYQKLGQKEEAKMNLLKFQAVCNEIQDNPYWKTDMVKKSTAAMLRLLTSVKEELHVDISHK